MDSSTPVKHHIPPMIIFFSVLISGLLISYIVDYVMQKYGCCGRRGGCCRPEVEQRNDNNDNNNDDVEQGQQEGIPLETLNAADN